MGILSVRYRGSARLDGKTAVITGCGTGIGKVTARDLYKRGCRVVMACIDVQEAYLAKCEIIKTYEGSSGTGELVLHKLDLASIKSVRQFAAKVMAEESRIDILINNAGVLCGKPQTTEDGFEMHFGVNHLGHFLLTLLLLPRMLASAPARIVNLSSSLHKFGRTVDWTNFTSEEGPNSKTFYNPYKLYSVSKLAVVLFTKELARRLQGTGVTVYAVHPGLVKTNIAHELCNAAMTKLYHHIGFLWLKDLKEGAATSIYCAVDEKAGKETGLYYDNCKSKRCHPLAEDAESASELWRVSATMTQLTHDPFVPQPSDVMTTQPRSPHNAYLHVT